MRGEDSLRSGIDQRGGHLDSVARQAPNRGHRVVDEGNRNNQPIGDLGQLTRTLHDVLEILATPVAPVGLLELAPVPGRSADVRREDDISVVREPLRRAIPPPLVLAGRAAVDVDERRWRRAAADRLGVRDVQERRDLASVGARIAHVHRLDQRGWVDRRRQ